MRAFDAFVTYIEAENNQIIAATAKAGTATTDGAAGAAEAAWGSSIRGSSKGQQQ